MKRQDGRPADQLRPVAIEPGFIDSAHGSVLFSIGRTRLVCTAMTSEYSLSAAANVSRFCAWVSAASVPIGCGKSWRYLRSPSRSTVRAGSGMPKPSTMRASTSIVETCRLRDMISLTCA